jgi:anti-sigma regulatory factor (Ser/Thr protein kinase)
VVGVCWKSERRYRCGRDAPAQARSFCEQHLRNVFDSTPEASAAIDDAALVVSELVTNAVNAGCSAATVALELHRDYLRLSVADNNQARPHLRSPTPRDAHGRGLRIVEQLTTSWGVDPIEADADGAPRKQVWAVLKLPPNLTPELHCTVSVVPGGH